MCTCFEHLVSRVEKGRASKDVETLPGKESSDVKEAAKRGRHLHTSEGTASCEHLILSVYMFNIQQECGNPNQDKAYVNSKEAHGDGHRCWTLWPISGTSHIHEHVERVRCQRPDTCMYPTGMTPFLTRQPMSNDHPIMGGETGWARPIWSHNAAARSGGGRPTAEGCSDSNSIPISAICECWFEPTCECCAKPLAVGATVSPLSRVCMAAGLAAGMRATLLQHIGITLQADGEKPACVTSETCAGNGISGFLRPGSETLRHK